MRATRVFLARVRLQTEHDPASVAFLQLGATPVEQTAQRASEPGQTVRFTAAAVGERCAVEWGSSTPSALRGGVGSALLEQGDGFVVGPIEFVIYVESTDDEGADPARDAVERIESLPANDRRDALRRFTHLPHVWPELSDAFSTRTDFVQCRDGRVPRARDHRMQWRGQQVWLWVEVAVWSMFTGDWSEPRLGMERRLTRADIAAIQACATSLRAIPAT